MIYREKSGFDNLPKIKGNQCFSQALMITPAVSGGVYVRYLDNYLEDHLGSGWFRGLHAIYS